MGSTSSPRRSSMPGLQQSHGSSTKSEPSSPITSSSSWNGKTSPQWNCARTPSGKRRSPAKTSSTPVGPVIASAEPDDKADVPLAREGEAEDGPHQARPPHRALVDERLQPHRLRVVPVHERLLQKPARALGRLEGTLRLRRASRERLLAEDVLPGLQRTNRPLDVQRVRERDVERLDVLVREQLGIAPVRALDPVRARALLGAGALAAGDRQELDLLRLLRRGDDPAVDTCCREEAPARHSSMRAAPMFSSRCSSEDVPGIGQTTGERLRSQASATWAGVASWARASSSSGPPGRASEPTASGLQGRNAMPSRSQASRTDSEERSAML